MPFFSYPSQHFSIKTFSNSSKFFNDFLSVDIHLFALLNTVNSINYLLLFILLVFLFEASARFFAYSHADLKLFFFCGSLARSAATQALCLIRFIICDCLLCDFPLNDFFDNVLRTSAAVLNSTLTVSFGFSSV